MKVFTQAMATLLLMAIVPFTSCKKGDVGAQGDKGDNGTANVIYSDWVYATDYKDSVIDNSYLKIAHIKAPALTSAHISQGTILVYFNFGGSVFAIPYTSNAGGKANTLNFIPTAGSLIITRFTNDNSGSINLSTSIQYRYVIIPGGIKATSSVNPKNYNAMKSTFDIKY